MEGVDLENILVALIAALGGFMANKASSRATTRNAQVTAETEKEKIRADVEREAYSRARKLDVETIERQESEIKELRDENKYLNADVKRVSKDNEILHELVETLREEVTALRQRLTRAERGLNPDSKEPIRERETDTNPMLKEVDYNGR